MKMVKAIHYSIINMADIKRLIKIISGYVIESLSMIVGLILYTLFVCVFVYYFASYYDALVGLVYK